MSSYPIFNTSALLLCSEAYRFIDFTAHHGSHPAIGAVDHVCFSPLVFNTNTISSISNIANSFASSLSCNERVPVYTYGHASSSSMKLRDIRRSLGYFDPNNTTTNSSTTEKSGPKIISTIRQLLSNSDSIKASYGDEYTHDATFDSKGVMCVGGIPMVLNFNMRFRPCDSKSLVMQVTKHVRQEGVGVEALTLQHTEASSSSSSSSSSYEVACNLTQSDKWGVEQVLLCARDKAKTLGIEIEHCYTTGPTIEELQRMFVDST